MPDPFEPDLRQGLRAHATRVGRPDDPAADVRRRLRRQDKAQRSLAAVGAVAVLAVIGVAGVPLLGGGGIVLDSSPPASQPAEPDRASGGQGTGWQTEGPCEAAHGGLRWQTQVPSGWWTPKDDAVRCRYFHPEPDAGVPNVAITFAVEPSQPEELLEVVDGDVLSHDSTSVDWNDATLIETRASGNGMHEEGQLGVHYFVGLGDRTLVASALDVPSVASYEEHQNILAHLMASLRVTRVEEDIDAEDSSFEGPATEESGDDGDDANEEEGQRCSAAGLAPETDPQPTLPTPAAETRERLIRAAAACDFDALGELAGDDLSASFGGEEDPVALWRQAEASGSEPLRALVEVLAMPHARREGDGSDDFVWPSAFAHDSWEDVPSAEREALRPLYDEEDLEGFAQFGSYIGYRVGIRADGSWIFFIAGD